MDGRAFESYLKAGRVAAQCLRFAREAVREGTPAIEIARQIDDLILTSGCRPAFPVNISIDADAAHYTPEEGDGVVFRSGQVVKVDVGVHHDGYISDSAVTVEVSTDTWKRLIEASEVALERALTMLRPGMPVTSISAVIEQTIRASGFNPVENLTGHHLERYTIHAGGSIPNIKATAEGVLREGDIIALEPFATPGAGRVESTGFGNIYRLLQPPPRSPHGPPGGLYHVQGAVLHAAVRLPMGRRG